ncbi:MAG: cadherin-like domain-containing protein [Aquincola sp.]|nr:cadherin-like domain-containing protein [Aquincola sp.]
MTAMQANRTPVAVNDSASGNEDTVLTGNVLGNDSDADGDALLVRLVAGPTQGSLTLNADGSFSFTPNADWNGSDGFQYLVSDGATGVVHYWGLEGNATDAVGAAAGTVVGAPATVAGRSGAALQFDGIDDHVALPDVAYYGTNIDWNTAQTITATGVDDLLELQGPFRHRLERPGLVHLRHQNIGRILGALGDAMLDLVGKPQVVQQVLQHVDLKKEKGERLNRRRQCQENRA